MSRMSSNTTAGPWCTSRAGGRAAFDHCAGGRQVAAHHGQALRRLERGIDGGDDVCGGGDAGGRVVGDGLAADGQRVCVQQGLD